MQVFVNCGRTHLVDVAPEATVEDVYALVAAREGVSSSQLYLISQGRMLEAGSLAANGVGHLSIIEASVRLSGGKVHGSLARAGKVKGQTPKVEKQEKKKKKTGKKRKENKKKKKRKLGKNVDARVRKRKQTRRQKSSLQKNTERK